MHPPRPLTRFRVRRFERPTFWGLAGAAAVGAAALDLSGAGDSFDRFLGPIPPLVAVGASTAVGRVALEVLSRRGWCPDRDRLDGPAAAKVAGAAAVLAGAAMAFDLVIPFDEDMNVAWPRSVAFYITIAFLAEVGLHLVPLTVLATVRDRLAARRSDRAGPGRNTVLAVILAVAAVEAAFQAAASVSGPDRRAALFVGPHLLAVGVVELLGFRRHGFAALATFRLTYYLLWHVLWGAVRLRLLF